MPTSDEIRRRFISELESGKSTKQATEKVAAGLHAPQRTPGSIPPPPAASAPNRDLAQARAEYTAATGKRPFHGWDYDELMRRIREASEY